MTPDPSREVPAWLMCWAKTDLDGRSRAAGRSSWNSLGAHGLDAAAVALELWDRYLAPTIRDRLAEAFGAGDQNRARLVIAFLIALHDMGKASDRFLHQFGTRRGERDELRTERRRWEEAARAAGLPLADDSASARWVRHEHITAAHLPRLLGCDCRDCDGVGDRHHGLHTVAVLLGGHHGHIPPKDTVDVAYGLAGPANWGEVHADMVDGIATVLGVDRHGLKDWVRPERPSALVLFSGLTVLADWIASDVTAFPFRSMSEPIESWWVSSRSDAAASVSRLNLERWKTREATWEELWRGTVPHAFQRELMGLLPERGAALTMIESGTGSGKTRMALWCALHFARTCGYSGLYMAMPTRAATNQIAGEIKKFIHGALVGRAANLAVVHGAAESTDLVRELLAAARMDANLDGLADAAAETFTPDTESDVKVMLDAWFLRRCLGLVSPFGVGTVDQVVLGAQTSRHWFLRMLGLAGKTVIIDEAHAYELFQQQLLTSAVEWLADAGASVVILSATLPASVRGDLAAAWCHGQGVRLDDAGEQGGITVVDDAGRVRRGGRLDQQPELRTDLTLMVDPGDIQLARTVLDKARDGGFVAVMCNRVESAVNLYEAMVAEVKTGGHAWRVGPADGTRGEGSEADAPDEVVIIHGRMSPRERLPIENRLNAVLGPGPVSGQPNPERRGRLIVIATSVLEQSLDLDFDWIITDLAPIDLLIQRRGRLHRHQVNDRCRRDCFASPRMSVRHRMHGGVPVVEADRRLRVRNDDGYVYSPYILAATWVTLMGRANTNALHQSKVSLVMPRDSSELIESVYGERISRTGALGALLDRTWLEWQRELEDERAEARTRVVRPYSLRSRRAISVADLASGPAHGDGDQGGYAGTRARSRLGDDSVSVVLLYKQDDNRLTFDREGLLPVPGRWPKADEKEYSLLRDHLLLNTVSIPERWFTRGVPPPDSWQIIRRGPLAKLPTMVVDRDGRCVSGPLGLTYRPKRGLGKARRAK